ncbi:MAG: hypothetical protein JNJ73_00335 [Hyphomonadaceae bacterium]|nr:hypothetical protein [Hyphomonadaceae bacterium]
MRAALLALALVCAASPAAAQSVAVAADAPSARVAFAERRALLAADDSCRYFTPQVRVALEAGALQARNALIRAGWTRPRLVELETAAISAARARDCADPRTRAAADRARAGFSGWARTPSMTFTGGARSWIARRAPDEDGWRLMQVAGGGARFGMRNDEVVLSTPLPAGQAPPSSAQLVVRDVARARDSLFEIPGRRASGLQAGVASPAASRSFLPRARRIEADAHGSRRLFLVFPNDVLAAMAPLDPREVADIRMDNGARILVEVGDLAAARAFLAAR